VAVVKEKRFQIEQISQHEMTRLRSRKMDVKCLLCSLREQCVSV